MSAKRYSEEFKQEAQVGFKIRACPLLTSNPDFTQALKKQKARN